MLPGRATGGSLPCGRYLLAPLNGNKEGSKCLVVLRVKPTPTRFSTNSLYTPLAFVRSSKYSNLPRQCVNGRCLHSRLSAATALLTTRISTKVRADLYQHVFCPSSWSTKTPNLRWKLFTFWCGVERSVTTKVYRPLPQLFS